MIHLFRFEPAAVHVSPHGQESREKFTIGEHTCIYCRVLMSFAAVWDSCGTGSCPGPVLAVPDGARL